MTINPSTAPQNDPNIQISRRRSGKQCYCWASIILPDGSRKDLGDPWPAMNWPQSVLLPEARRALAEFNGDQDAAKRHAQESMAAQRALLVKQSRSRARDG